ncbi:hypothetical protein LAX75_11550 [Listeria cossartiae]|uniref:SMI1/KNR4 family protein n=1 Tax=Listeria cossartiae subsp. cayugensis TaxID=2713505 RepID=A0ABU2IP65_9LIST|nr:MULTISPECIES: hypothetical protein [Listeria]MCD2225463.1 hypothetical protein [Listeria cossartiae]MCD2240014.1 hypothetical protein [Listeria cossartiae]MCD2254897.1 hypothetical protein [Listeria marthii]MDT0049987.1 hypothetical protein [Listeria cossartiae subsp. cayugensis]MDT0066489.1 hypothetical protein [Listeria cossartiae subsp. cayugensis]
MFSKLNFKNGDITFLDQSDLLKEDILQVQYPDDLLLDVGYYEKQYKIFVIKNLNWEEPTVVCVADNFNDLLCKLQKIINEISMLK